MGRKGAVAAHAIVLVFMPPEPLPCDRKDFFRERKHERSESLGSVTRWRDSSHHGSRELNRWGSADFRRPPGMCFFNCHGTLLLYLGLKYSFFFVFPKNCFALDFFFFAGDGGLIYIFHHPSLV